MAEWYVDYSSGDDTTGTGAIGAPYKTVAKALTVWAPSDRINLKNNAAHVITTALQPTGAMGGSTGVLASVIQGYTSTAGDGGVAEITCATNSVSIFNFLAGTTATFLKLGDLKLSHTAATRGKGITGATGAGSTQGNLLIDNVEIAGCSNGHDSASRIGLSGWIRKLYIHDCTTSAIINFGGAVHMIDCRIDNNAGSGIIFLTNANPAKSNIFTRCQFTRNSGDGLKSDFQNRTGQEIHFYGCTFADNTGDGWDGNLSGTGSMSAVIADCVFWGNGGYNIVGGALNQEPDILNCAFGGATLGNVSGSGWTTGKNPQTLASSPFVGSGDYTPANTSEGNKLKGTGIQGGYIGAICPAFGGGGSTIYSFGGSMTGGMVA